MGQGRRRTKVLLVEDEPLVAMHLHSVLVDELGFEDVRVAHTLRAGLHLAIMEPPGLAVLDIDLGGELVFPLARALQARAVPFLFCTGRSPKDLPPEWSDSVVVPKPLDVGQLREALKRLGLVSPRDLRWRYPGRFGHPQDHSLVAMHGMREGDGDDGAFEPFS